MSKKALLYCNGRRDILFGYAFYDYETEEEYLFWITEKEKEGAGVFLSFFCWCSPW
jgi:hypothetical protein